MGFSNPFLTKPNDEDQSHSTTTTEPASSDDISIDMEDIKCYNNDSEVEGVTAELSKVRTNEQRHETFIETIPFHRRRSSLKSSLQTTDVEGLKLDFTKELVEDFKQENVTMSPNHEPVEKHLSEYQHSLFIKHRKYHTGTGISAILSRPANEEQNLHKGILLLHGHCGHKNYINLPIIDDLLQKRGYYILRVDFRGLGNSEDNADPVIGRTLQQDIEDIETCYLFFRDIVNVKLDTIIAHSRAVISMFEFHLMLQSKYQDFIPNLINCSGRYDNEGLKDKILAGYPDWLANKGYYTNTFRFGKLQSIFIPYSESMSVIKVDSRRFSKIDQRCSVLSVYGCKEQVMPLSAATKYDKLFKKRHRLILIDEADHNFYGIVENNPNNPLQLPTKRGKINYNYLVGKNIEDYLSIENKVDRFATFNNSTNCTRVGSTNEATSGRKRPVLTYSRWPAPSVISKIRNLRDFGGYTTLNEAFDTRGGIFYKSGTLKDISQEGVLLLKNALRLEQIFIVLEKTEEEDDLLPKNYPSIFTPVKTKLFWLENSFSDAVADSTGHYYNLFLNMEEIFKHIILFIALAKKTSLIGQENSVLFVSKNGQIKTSLVSLVILKLLGVDDYTICMEHCLTTWANHRNKRSKTSPDAQSKTSNDSLIMMKLIERINTDFGSIEDYVTGTLKIPSDTIMRLREQCLV